MVFVGLVAVFGLFLFFKNKDRVNEKMDFLSVKRGDLKVEISASGFVSPQNRVDVKPPISGRIEQFLVKEGDYVQKGHILAWMSSTERAALIDLARTKGKEEVQKWEGLYKATPLISPVSGTVISKAIKSGQSVAQNDVMLTLSDTLIIKVDVDETDLAKIHLGQHADVQFDAMPDQKVKAIVTHISFDSKVVSNVVKYTVDLQFQGNPSGIRSGMSANMTFVTEKRENVLLLPLYAAQEQDGTYTVLLQKGNDLEKKVINTGITDGRMIEILSGLNEGEQVAIQRFSGNSQKRGKNPFSTNPGRKRDKK